jgi:hypothetical protein
MSHTVHRNLLALVLALASGLAIYFVAHSSSAQSDSTQLTGSAATVASEIGAFQAPETAEDALPSEPTISGTLARRIGSASASEWATIDNARLCLQDESGASVCAPVESYSGNPLVMEPGGANGPERVVGLAPDGISSVTAVFKDGSTKTADVANNGFSMAVSEAASQIEWTTSDGVNHKAEGEG